MNENKIYVGNLSYSVSEDDLKQHFDQYGPIGEVKLIIDRDTNRSKGFAFITFDSKDAADAALAANGCDLQGRAMKVNVARDNNRGGRRGGNGGGHRGPMH